MRTIKFRAWDVKEQKMYEWSNYFFYDTSPVTCYSGDFSYIDENMILMQYIGLKDKNGKEIYEGDIVKHTFKIGDGFGYVYFSTPSYGLKLLNTSGVCTEFTWSDFQQFEVIGNIHQNPEALTKE